ncbi:hypothetical protein QE152_g38907 [Popillia japonica]|uniref:Uncharacterized protein n=1 Tax=Popillia japonica TaxID=7064 RepID=A0AAW1HVB0_POPJA
MKHVKELTMKEMRKGLTFKHRLFDAVLLNDGRNALILGYGVYSDQYWCEMVYPDGLHVGEADWVSADLSFSCPQIVEVIPNCRDTLINKVIDEYKAREIGYILDYSRIIEDLLNAMDM